MPHSTTLMRQNQKFRRLRHLIGKLPAELNGNQKRTLTMGIRDKWLIIDKFTGIIHKKDNW